MKKFITIVSAALCLLAASCSKQEQGSDNPGNLNITFDIQDPLVEAGKSIEIPFKVTGNEGVAIDIEAYSDDKDVELKVKYNASYEGKITLTAPAKVEQETTVKVTIKAWNNKNKLEKSIDVKMVSMKPLTLTATSEVDKVTIEPGGSFSIQYKVGNLEEAKLVGEPEVKLTAGWTSKAEVSGDVISVTFTAPAEPSDKLSVEINIADDCQRTASCKAEISVTVFIPTGTPANCFIAKPGEKVNIKAVKGNSDTGLDFDGASLIWQDCQSLVKAVTFSVKDKTITASLTEGKEGNAVVAALKGSDVVWSWHIWVTAESPMDVIAGGYTFLDRDLGALTNKFGSDRASGTVYQWGRKDAYAGTNYECGLKAMYDINNAEIKREVVVNTEVNNIPNTILHPLTIYTNVYTQGTTNPHNYSWITTDFAQIDSTVVMKLWDDGGKKTIYDPCPAGYRVPSSDVFQTLKAMQTIDDKIIVWDESYVPDPAEVAKYDELYREQYIQASKLRGFTVGGLTLLGSGYVDKDGVSINGVPGAAKHNITVNLWTSSIRPGFSKSAYEFRGVSITGSASYSRNKQVWEPSFGASGAQMSRECAIRCIKE